MSDDLDLGAVLDHYSIRYRADRAGEQMISCPVHEDRKPSASCNLSKGLWNCHSCGKSGDALTIIMEREAVLYEAAVEVYESITGTSGKSVRSRNVGATPESRRAIPAGQGYKPRVNRKLPPGVRSRTDFGA